MSYWVLITREHPQEQAHVIIGPFKTLHKANKYQHSIDVDYICKVDAVDCFAGSDEEKQIWIFELGKDPLVQLFPIENLTSEKLTEKRKVK